MLNEGKSMPLAAAQPANEEAREVMVMRVMTVQSGRPRCKGRGQRRMRVQNERAKDERTKGCCNRGMHHVENNLSGMEEAVNLNERD